MKKIFICFTLFVVLFLAGNAQAALLKLNFSGNVSKWYAQNPDNRDLSDLTGMPVFASATIDLSAMPIISNNQPGFSFDLFSDAVRYFSATIGGNYHSLFDQALQFNRSDTFNSADISSYQWDGYLWQQLDLSFSSNNPINMQNFVSSLYNRSSPFYFTYFYSYSSVNGNNYELISATFDNVSVSNPSEVPLPAAVWLFGSAMLSIMAIKRKTTIVVP